jgi:hypothetical protein
VPKSRAFSGGDLALEIPSLIGEVGNLWLALFLSIIEMLNLTMADITVKIITMLHIMTMVIKVFVAQDKMLPTMTMVH